MILPWLGCRLSILSYATKYAGHVNQATTTTAAARRTFALMLGILAGFPLLLMITGRSSCDGIHGRSADSGKLRDSPLRQPALRKHPTNLSRCFFKHHLITP